ncbi:apolipoprotein N-acyltransferase [Bacterioplanoides pacificum]|uniref:Apolipoprotein N-acyltransferase n=1 Tax=Bacterioplanoides pacificum TaxID=1171596 RepID=A0ABV7VUW1_9GAMM
MSQLFTYLHTGQSQQRWLSPLLLWLAGALFPVALAPLLWWPVGLLSIAVFVHAIWHSQSVKQAFWRTWWFSFGKFATGVSWIYVSMHDHGGTPAILATLLVGLFAAFLATFPASWFALRQKVFGQHLAWLTIAVFWFLHEWFRSWFMTGFPWLFAGDAHLFSWLAGWAPVIGSYGISLIVVLSLSATYQAWQTRQPAYLLVLLLWPAGWLLQQQEWTEATGELKVAAVQGNIPQDRKWLPEMVTPTIEQYYSATREHWDADLVLWPETAVTMLLDQFQPYLDAFSREAQKHHTTLITGVPYRYPRGTELAGEYHNSVVASGNGEGIYHKQQLVPFGEFVPLEDQIRGLIPFFDLQMSSFLHGRPDQPLLKVSQRRDNQDQLYLIAPYICYEIAYPQLVSQMARQADLLITVSNDAWFGDSLGPKQHMALAQMRALETGRFLLRATNTGITALVNHKGEIITRLATEQRATLTGSAEMRQGQTPYMRFGLWPLWLFSGLVLSVAGVQVVRRGRPAPVANF